MAKQFGVGDEAIRGLNDPERYPFPPDQKAALLFADAMTRGGGEVPDDLFDELRRHFSEPQIVEIACVVGTFNYFNRFNNAFRMDITLTDTEVVVRRVEQAIEGAPRDALDACERVVEILAQGRTFRTIPSPGPASPRRARSSSYRSAPGPPSSGSSTWKATGRPPSARRIARWSSASPRRWSRSSGTIRSRPERGWCERRDSNPHGLPHRILSPARLPVPPLSQCGAPPGVYRGTRAES